MARKKPKGRRLSVWIPESEYWLFDALRLVQERMESKGVPVSRADLCREILAEKLAPHRTTEPLDRIVKPLPLKERRVRVLFRSRDSWLLEALKRIVATKVEAGVKKSTVGYELVRLARNGLVGEMEGSEMDRAILRKSEA